MLASEAWAVDEKLIYSNYAAEMRCLTGIYTWGDSTMNWKNIVCMKDLKSLVGEREQTVRLRQLKRALSGCSAIRREKKGKSFQRRYSKVDVNAWGGFLLEKEVRMVVHWK